jgi:hypothetical protein
LQNTIAKVGIAQSVYDVSLRRNVIGVDMLYRVLPEEASDANDDVIAE